MEGDRIVIELKCHPDPVLLIVLLSLSSGDPAQSLAFQTSTIAPDNLCVVVDKIEVWKYLVTPFHSFTLIKETKIQSNPRI